ncbi:MAG: type II toxin-antitoxin system HicA family toxin [candidate division Zixibacteria bacterium]|nr:type II toxin-antitoxin system HicA family toxin [Candidatus Tariuqbacter arcticus]
MKRKKLLAYLNKRGCVFVREGRSHTIYENPDQKLRVPIPRHNEIPESFAKTICKQLGITNIEEK